MATERAKEIQREKHQAEVLAGLKKLDGLLALLTSVDTKLSALTGRVDLLFKKLDERK